MKCAKCNKRSIGGFVEGGTYYPCCKTCMDIVESFPARDVVRDFFKPEDEMSQVMKNIFEARERRAQGISSFQPERSKREDFWPSDHIWCGCPECGECKCKRCGALNSMET